MKQIAVVVWTLFSIACAGEAPTIQGCASVPGIVPTCGLQNPEDLAILPGGEFLVASQGRRPGQPPGSLVALRLSDLEAATTWPRPAGAVDLDSARPVAGWGDASCPGPPDRAEFSPHGIDLSERSGLPTALLVVNHGARESVEWFEVAYADGAPLFAWRGCALAPEGVGLNDVAALVDGGFVATNLGPPAEGLSLVWGAIRLLFGRDTGYVIEWDARTGATKVPGSDAPTPNGIVASPDASRIWFAAWAAREVRRLDRTGEPRIDVVPMPGHPDNLTWAPDGRILVATHGPSVMATMGCMQIESGVCGLPFHVVAVDPDTLETEVIFETDGTVAMGAATVALQHGDDIYIGTFAGDRIARLTPGSETDSAER